MLPFQPFNQRLANNWPNAGFQGKLARRHETYCPCSSLVFFASLPSNKHKTWYKPSVEAILSLTCVRSTVPDVLYSGFVPRARVFNLCHEYYLQRAEYIWQKNDLSSLVSLYRSNFQSGVVTHIPKMNTSLVCGVHIPTCKKSETCTTKSRLLLGTKMLQNLLSKFSARHTKTFACIVTVSPCHDQITISASNAQTFRPHLLSWSQTRARGPSHKVEYNRNTHSVFLPENLGTFLTVFAVSENCSLVWEASLVRGADCCANQANVVCWQHHDGHFCCSRN